MGLLSWLSGKKEGQASTGGGGGAASSGGSRISNADVNNALRKLDGTPGSITEARRVVGSTPMSNSERAEAYRRINGSVTYRNQRDNADDGDVMCNMTSMAMAMNGLGLGTDESKTGQYENVLDKKRAGRGLSRYDEDQRETLAEGLGVDAVTLKTPGFANGDAAKAWYMENVFPRMAAGATATFGVEGGNGGGGKFRHVIRLEWVEDKGLRTDDPFGAGVQADEAGTVGYSKLNEKQGQGGVGANGLLSWEQVARMNKNKYVQLYATKGQPKAPPAGAKVPEAAKAGGTKAPTAPAAAAPKARRTSVGGRK